MIIRHSNDFDTETGEEVNRQEMALPQFFDKDRGYKMLARKQNIRTFPDLPLPKDLTHTDIGHLFVLGRTSLANNGVIGTLYKRGFVPFDDEQMIEYIGFTSAKRGRAWLKRMVAMSMLRSIDVNLPDGVKERQWYLNPLYFCPMFLIRESYMVWRDQIDKYLPQYVRAAFAAQKREKITTQEELTHD